MPDLAMCKGGGCPMRDNCYRFTATPSGRQSYMPPPLIKLADGRVRCDYLYPNGKAVQP
jgi:hypothetical protein